MLSVVFAVLAHSCGWVHGNENCRSFYVWVTMAKSKWARKYVKFVIMDFDKSASERLFPRKSAAVPPPIVNVVQILPEEKTRQ